jgi:LmbE family N-acetylglucosaminyl deacetylase
MHSLPAIARFERVLCVAAHPDDLEFGAAGTVATLADEGTHVTYLLATPGQSGSSDPVWTPESLATARRGEQQVAADVLGVKEVAFLDFVDGYVEETIELRREISRAIRRYQPELVIAMKPGILLGTFINHPDHRAVAGAVLDSVLTGATTRLIFPELLEEGLEPWTGLAEVWLMGPGPLEDNVIVVDITGSIDRKIEALRSHESQLGEWNPSEMIRTRCQEVGSAAGFAYGERFIRLVRRERATPPASPS